VNLNGGSRSTGRWKGKEQVWTAERGLERGREALLKARNEDGVDGESVREYSRLVLQVLAREEGVSMTTTTEEAIQKEVKDENTRIVERLLNVDTG